MRNSETEPIRYTPCHWAGLACVITAGLLFMVHWRLSVIVLSVYALWCALAPFLPRIGFYAPVISRGSSGREIVSLTFDDGPDPLATPPLLKLLSARGVTATFFVSGCKVSKYPDIVEAIIRHGHTVGNHSFNHDPLVYFKGDGAVRNEIESTQRALAPFGIIPRVYRPPVGIVGPGLRQPLRDAGLRIVNFSCRALDCGNKRIGAMADRIMRRVRADDIILLHDILPGGNAHCRVWLAEIEKLLNGLQTKGLSVVPLEELIGEPVMEFKRGSYSLVRSCDDLNYIPVL